MKNKICLLTFNENHNGGVHTRLNTLYKFLSKYHLVRIISVKEYMHKNRLESFENLFPGNKVRVLFNTYSLLRLELNKYDLVISFSLLPSLISLFNTCKHIFIATGSAYYSRDSPLYSRILWTFILQPFIYIFTDAIVPAGPHLVPKAMKIPFLKDKTHYITGLIDISRLQKQFKKEEMTIKCLEKVQFISISSYINKHKGIQEFIEIYADYVELQGDMAFKLVILGDGPFLEQCIDRCNTLGLEIYKHDSYKSPSPQVYFLGFIDNPIEVISKSKIFAMPSFYEGISNQLLEAGFCNVNIISSNCPGNRIVVEELIRHQENDTTNSKSILMPIISSHSIKKLWVKGLISLQNHSNLLIKNHQPNSDFIYDFSLQKNGKIWLSLIDKLIKIEN